MSYEEEVIETHISEHMSKMLQCALERLQKLTVEILSPIVVRLLQL